MVDGLFFHFCRFFIFEIFMRFIRFEIFIRLDFPRKIHLCLEFLDSRSGLKFQTSGYLALLFGIKNWFFNVWDRDRSFRFWDRVSDLNYMLRDSRYKFLNLGFCMQIRMQIRILGWTSSRSEFALFQDAHL